MGTCGCFVYVGGWGCGGGCAGLFLPEKKKGLGAGGSGDVSWGSDAWFRALLSTIFFLEGRGGGGVLPLHL